MPVIQAILKAFAITKKRVISMRIGIDLGGTKIEVVAMEQSGEIVLRRRESTPKGDYSATLGVIQHLVTHAEKELATTASVGMATPGAISVQTGRLKNSNSTCLNDQPLQQDLESLLQRKVRLANDANCFALSEAVDGAAVGASSVFGVILGTGTGGGLVINGHIHTGANAIAGEWGHNPLPWLSDDERPGHVCYCGQHGCIETFLSGPGMSAWHAQLTGQRMEPEAIVEAAEQGDELCQVSLGNYIDRLSRALAHVINIVDPDVIVLGGGMSNISALYDEVPKRWSKWVFSDHIVTKLVPPIHGDSSGVRGAAWLWND